jgi:glutamate racemase
MVCGMIGMFDSGSGGLTVLSALRKRAPRADIVYFGDIAHAPYGVRSADELSHLTRAAAVCLREAGATELVSACNSVSPAVLSGAAEPLPAIEMSAPTRHGMQGFCGKNVLLIATPATVRSGMYENAFGHLLTLDSLAVSALAGAIEAGEGAETIAAIVREAFAARAGKRYDALLLGCTHYPLVRETIESEAAAVFGTIECIDPAAFVAEEAARRFDLRGSGAIRLLISKDSAVFRSFAARLLPEAGYTIEVV